MDKMQKVAALMVVIALATFAISGVFNIHAQEMTPGTEIYSKMSTNTCSEAELANLTAELSKTDNAVVQANILSNFPCA